jgi:hypothetical protein
MFMKSVIVLIYRYHELLNLIYTLTCFMLCMKWQAMNRRELCTHDMYTSMFVHSYIVVWFLSAQNKHITGLKEMGPSCQVKKKNWHLAPLYLTLRKCNSSNRCDMYYVVLGCHRSIKRYTNCISYKNVTRETWKERTFLRCRCVWENNVKMDVGEMGCENV